MTAEFPKDVDEMSFEAIVNAFYEPLFRFAFSLSKSQSEASDLTQETFFRYAQKGHQLRDRSKVKSWLFTTLYRHFLGLQRRETRFPHVEMSDSEHELPNINPSLARTIDAHTAIAALSQIKEIYRAPLTLLYLEDHSYQEIAEILEIPIGTVMSRLARGKEHLRQQLAAQTSPESSEAPIPFPARNK